MVRPHDMMCMDTCTSLSSLEKDRLRNRVAGIITPHVRRVLQGNKMLRRPNMRFAFLARRIQDDWPRIQKSGEFLPLQAYVEYELRAYGEDTLHALLEHV